MLNLRCSHALLIREQFGPGTAVSSLQTDSQPTVLHGEPAKLPHSDQGGRPHTRLPPVLTYFTRSPHGIL
jgi:hypothetical protein